MTDVACFFWHSWTIGNRIL